MAGVERAAGGVDEGEDHGEVLGGRDVVSAGPVALAALDERLEARENVR